MVLHNVLRATSVSEAPLYHDDFETLNEAAHTNLQFMPDKSSSKVYEWSVQCGSYRSTAIKVLVDLARHFGTTQKADFNGIALIATPRDTEETVLVRYNVAEKVEREKYLKSPDYRAYQESQLKEKQRIQQGQMDANKRVENPSWDPLTPKNIDDSTSFVLRALLAKAYPEGEFAYDRFMYEVKDFDKAEKVRINASTDLYGSIIIKSVNKFVLALELALMNGYNPSRELIDAAEIAIDEGFSGAAYGLASFIIERTWVNGDNFKSNPVEWKPVRDVK